MIIILPHYCIIKKTKSQLRFLSERLRIYLIHQPSTSYKQNWAILLFFLYFFKLDGVVYLATREEIRPFIVKFIAFLSCSAEGAATCFIFNNYDHRTTLANCPW